MEFRSGTFSRKTKFAQFCFFTCVCDRSVGFLLNEIGPTLSDCSRSCWFLNASGSPKILPWWNTLGRTSLLALWVGSINLNHQVWWSVFPGFTLLYPWWSSVLWSTSIYTSVLQQLEVAAGLISFLCVIFFCSFVASWWSHVSIVKGVWFINFSWYIWSASELRKGKDSVVVWTLDAISGCSYVEILVVLQ